VQIQHELCECALQSCDLASDHDESRSRDAAGSLEIQRAEVLSELDVVTRFEAEAARLTCAAQLDIGALIRAHGH
jgi:hypothetical protein